MLALFQALTMAVLLVMWDECHDQNLTASTREFELSLQSAIANASICDSTRDF